MILALLLACGGGDDTAGGVAPGDDTAAAPGLVHPFVAVRADDRQAILDRIGQEPWASTYARLQAEAGEALRDSGPDAWDHDVVGDNAMTAQAAALLAWLHQDPEWAAVAIAAMDAIETDFENSTTWDVNIRMPAPLIGYTSAWDLLMAGGFLDEAQEQAYAEAIVTLTGKFFDAYVADDATRLQLMAYTQNNHPLRTAAAVGVPGLAFRDRYPEAQVWLDWAASETAWLLSEQGRYVMEDGGVSEGPFYYGFGMSAVLAFLVAMDHAAPDGTVLTWDCRNRVDVDPWTSEGCVDGAPLTWANPLRDPWYLRSFSWSLALRLPDGLRPPLADGYFVQQNGGAIAAAALLADPEADPDLLAEAPAWVWDWLENAWYPADTSRSFDLGPQHLARLTPQLVAAAAPPQWTMRVMEPAGNAVLRSSWEPDALWALLVAEHDSVRKTVHDHVDGLSLSMAAYGEYLVLDPGYYKPSSLDNAVTADADAHNVILVDGQGAPDKGLMFNWGDADAWLDVSLDSSFSGDLALDYVEAHQSYEEVDFERGVLMVRDRYLVVLDRTDTTRTDARDYTWRLGGAAGYDSGGAFALGGQGARWEREAAGFDLVVAASEGTLAVVEPELVEGEAPHVHEYDRSRSVGEHAVADAVARGVGPDFVAVLAPYRVGEPEGAADGPLEVQVLDLGPGVAALWVGPEDGGDLALVREVDAPMELVLPGGQVLWTDARAVFLGEVHAEGLPRQGLMADGSGLWVGEESRCDFDEAYRLCSWTLSEGD